MGSHSGSDLDGARAASREEIPALLHHHDEKVLAALLENPQLEESHLLLLLEHGELPGSLLEAIARRKEWLRSYRLRRALAFHVHMPRLVAMRLARELYLMDLVQLSLQLAVTAELRRFAEEQVLAQLGQLPLGQKLMLARRASSRVAGSLIAEGHRDVVAAALDNAFLTEAQVLKVMSRAELPAPAVLAIASHRKWSQLYAVRLALVRHPNTPLERVLAFLPDLTQRDLIELARSSVLPPRMREFVHNEIARRAAARPAKEKR